jgi:hypothetical protein
MGSKQKEMKTLEDGIRKKEKEKAEAEIELAAAVQEYDDTDAQMKGDIEFFDEAKEACTDKSEEWTEREELRTAELDGIKEALGILTSDEAREMFAKSIKPGFETFIQVDASESNPVLAATEKAYSVVKALTSKADDKKAVEFARLAVSIKESASAMKKKGKGARDQFGAVLAEIDKIIGNLKDEGQADIDNDLVDLCQNCAELISCTLTLLLHRGRGLLDGHSEPCKLDGLFVISLARQRLDNGIRFLSSCQNWIAL